MLSLRAVVDGGMIANPFTRPETKQDVSKRPGLLGGGGGGGSDGVLGSFFNSETIEIRIDCSHMPSTPCIFHHSRLGVHR